MYSRFFSVCVALALVAGCGGPADHTGATGPTGSAGPNGTAGRNAYLTRPGLHFTIQSVALTGKAFSVTFQITDPAGTPLDRQGLYTEGAVTSEFILAWLNDTGSGIPGEYTSYTTHIETDLSTAKTATQAVMDSGGVYRDVDAGNGIYAYDFGTPIQMKNSAATHTVGAWAQRTVNGVNYPANASYDFVPDGSPVTHTRDVVTTSACNICHDPLSAHAGTIREVKLCLLCHSAQTSDPFTGHSLDFRVLLHTLHTGKDLASLGAGPFQLEDNQQTVYDFSTVVFPQDIGNCAACHAGNQGNLWQSEPPTRLICGSCHDGTWFGAGAGPTWTTPHAGGPQADDSNCAVCHPPTTGLEPVTLTHRSPARSASTPKLGLRITSVTSTAPGQTPQVAFDVTVNGAPYDILANLLPRLAVTVAGPTTDYASYWQYVIQGAGAQGALALNGDAGSYLYTFGAPMPVSATGSYAFALEGYLQPAGAGTAVYAAVNPVVFAAVTDDVPVPRRKIVDSAQCNLCHSALTEHSASMEVQYCPMCHNPNKANDQRVARFEVPATTAQSVSFGPLIHQIHRGVALTQQPYVIGGFPAPTPANPAGTPLDYGQDLYPGDLRDCQACHAGTTYVLPLSGFVQPALSEVLACTDSSPVPTAYCVNRVVAQQNFTPPVTSACTGCHDDPAVAAHASTMTSSGGVEACAACHGPGSAYDVARVHQVGP